VVDGTSMFPTFNSGDYVICRRMQHYDKESKLTLRDYSWVLGKTIIFRNAKSLMLKRVILVNDDIDVINGLCSATFERNDFRVCYNINRKLWDKVSCDINDLEYLSLNNFGLKEYHICFSRIQVETLFKYINQDSVSSAGVIGDYAAELNIDESSIGYFVLGDNRMYSVDSRILGLIRHRDVLGYVIAKL